MQLIGNNGDGLVQITTKPSKQARALATVVAKRTGTAVLPRAPAMLPAFLKQRVIYTLTSTVVPHQNTTLDAHLISSNLRHYLNRQSCHDDRYIHYVLSDALPLT